MSTYLLIHGAWHGAWCWTKVVPLLKQAGHTVIAPDLPGHGQDHTPPEQITLEAYVSRVVSILEQVPEPVILVGHDLGGMVISQVAEVCPEHICLLVYLAALLPRNGESAMQLYARDVRSRMDQCVNLDRTAGRISLYTGQAEAVFYHDCSSHDLLIVQEHLTTQALAPLLTPVRLTERFAGVPRTAMLCEYDQVITLSMQAEMATLTPCEIPVIPLPSGHAPFFSVPDQVAHRLLEVARHGQTAPKALRESQANG